MKQLHGVNFFIIEHNLRGNTLINKLHIITYIHMFFASKFNFKKIITYVITVY